jgi:hypothetical protein
MHMIMVPWLYVYGSYIIAGVTSSRCGYALSSSSSWGSTSIYQCPSATKSTPVGGWAMMINSSSGLLGQLVADVDTSGLASISYDRYSWPTLTTSLIPSSSIPLITSASYSALNVLSTGNYFACIRLY